MIARADLPDSESEPAPSGRWARFRPGPYGWMLVAVAGFFAVTFALSWLRALEFQTTTWDMGLYQQALWSTAHGRPFYETADVETGGYGSLLQIHSVFLFYLLVPLYQLFPYETTLFAVQSAVVALAALPLYFLARDLSRSPRLGLLAGIAFLTWTPVLSSTLYDFHPEAFLPLEMFTLALLWERGRFRWGFFVAAVAFCTIEIAPVLTCFFALFALLIAGREPPTLAFVSDSNGFRRRSLAAVRDWARRPRVQASLALLVTSALAYTLLLYLRVDFLTTALGTYPLPQAPSGYVIGATPSALGLAGNNLTAGFVTKVTYWLVALALLAFVPVLAPRALVLTVPWFAFTLLSANLNYVTLGFQYGFIAASSLLVAFAYGLPEARRLAQAYGTRAVAAARDSVPSPPVLRVFRRRRVALIVGVAALLTLNVALSPLDPAMQNNGLGSAYRLSYSPGPGDSEVQQLVGLIPPGATVVASDDLFPLVANDEGAYSFLWTADTALFLPFNDSHLPTYALVAGDRAGAVPPWLATVLYDPALFSVRGVAWSTGVGTVLLFEAGGSDAPSQFGPAPPVGGTYYGSEVVSPEAGFPTSVPDSAYPSVVKSAPGAVGTVWYGPGTSLDSGNYTVTLSLRVSTLSGFPVPSATTPVLWIGAIAFGLPSLAGAEWTYGSLNSSGWTSVEFRISVPAPAMQFDVQGVLLDSSVQVTLNYIEVASG